MFTSTFLKEVAERSAKKTVANFSKLPIDLFSHLISDKHEKKHRFFYGVAVIIIGTVFSKAGNFFHSEILNVCFEGVGFFIHAAGCTPFIDEMAMKCKC